MTDLVTLWAGATTIGFCSLAYLLVATRIDRDEARAERDQARSDLAREMNVSTALDRRCTTLRGDNIVLEQKVDRLREGHDRLVAERDSAVRELGRLKAEQRAAKPKRGPNGRFISKPKATVTPIKCG